MTSEINRCYRALELEPGASLEQVKQAWRELVKVWHPDRFPNDAKLQRKAQERLKEINGAYEILEQYLTSGTPPPRNRASSSRTSEQTHRQDSQRHESESRRAETPPPPPPPPRASEVWREPKKSRVGVVWAVVVVVVALPLILAVVVGIVALLLNLANSGNNLSRSQAYVPPPVSKMLDEKNGFKDFKFGMTPQEARAVLPPTAVTERPGANATDFLYRATPVNRIGDFSTDALSLSFFGGDLYRLDLSFSAFPNEILEACKANYGEPFDDEGWTQGEKKLRARSWRGEKISAAILSSGLAWDSLVIYDVQANQRAQEYAAKEPQRAAKDFGPSGFKSLVVGTKLQDLTVEYEIVKEDRVSGVKGIAFRKGDWRNLGFYPLRSLSAEFFNDRLYRIDLGFEANRKEMLAAFEHRFGPLQDDETWTSGTTKLKAKSATKGKIFAVILASQTYPGKRDDWDFIVLYDVDLWREAEQFKKDEYVEKVEHFLVAGREMNVYLGIASLAATEFDIIEDVEEKLRLRYLRGERGKELHSVVSRSRLSPVCAGFLFPAVA